MNFKPNDITRENVLSGIKIIEEDNIELIPSTRFLVEINGKNYPPKEVMRYAHQQMNGEKIWEYSGGDQTNKFLEKMGFKIIEKYADPIKDIINTYKSILKKDGLNGEIYKWKLLNQFQCRPNINTPNFKEEIDSIKFENLIFFNGIRVIHHLAKEKAEEYRECFNKLFNEEIQLDERLKNFEKDTLRIYRGLEKKLPSHHDERTTSTFLTYHNPNKYTFYKYSVYKRYCNLIGRPLRAKGNRYTHYLELIDDLIENYIKPDSELLSLVSASLPSDAFPDQEQKILAQDILYQTLEKLSANEGVVALMASDSTGWQDGFIKGTKDAETSIVWNSKRPSGTNETLKFLRNIVESENTFNIYYSSGNLVNYKATIIDFVENQRELDEKQWNNKYNVELYYDNFSEYKDEKKFAKIVFLAKSLEKIKPIPISSFEFYNGYEAPRQDNLSPIKKEPEEAVITIGQTPEKEPKMKNVNLSLNQILYGPPGTGKTYNTINKALEIIGENLDGKTRPEIKVLFDEKMKEGRIVFTTFHQSMSYEDFVEGIKPQKAEEDDEFLKYEVEPGIFKILCNKAKSIKLNNYKIDWDKPTYYKMSLGGKNQPNIHEWCIENNVIALGWGGSEDLSKYSSIKSWKEYRDKYEKEFPALVQKSRYSIQATYAFMQMKKDDIVVISKGNHIIDAIGIIKGGYFWDDQNSFDYYHFRKVEWIAKNINTSPDRFFKKQISQMSIYEFSQKDLKLEAFKEITCQVSDNNTKPFVLIIDEINRGNISQIFGELITLIEDDKRLGKEESLEVTLPYSKEKFGVPSNLYIIGTMNTADRSVEALDTALRRRFSFVEIPPDARLVASEGKLKKHNGQLGDINLPLVLNTLNNRIEKLLDKDHQIGHSYFMSVNNISELKIVFQNKIIPLLQEYFFGDYGKIGLVIGEGFFEPLDTQSENLFAEFYDYDASEFAERTIYKLKNISNVSDSEFIEAINLLLRK